MKVFRKISSLVLSGLVFGLLSSENALAYRLNQYGGEIFETPLEICQRIDAACVEQTSKETPSGSFVSGEEINLISDAPLVVESGRLGVYFFVDNLTINFFTPVEFNGFFEWHGDFIFNDFTEGDIPTLISKNSDTTPHEFQGSLTLNNLKTKSALNVAVFEFSFDSKLVANSVRHFGDIFLYCGSNQEVVINGGVYEAQNLVFGGTEYAKSFRILDGEFRTFDGEILYFTEEQDNIEIVSGSFESTASSAEPVIFRIFSSTSKGASEAAVARLVADGSELFDEERGTTELVYSNVSIDQKGEQNFGFISTKKLVVRQTGGQGSEDEEPEAPASVEEEVASKPEEPTETEETEENPETSVGTLVFNTYILYMVGFFASLLAFASSLLKIYKN